MSIAMEEMMNSIEVDHVSMKFFINDEGVDSLSRSVSTLLRPRQKSREEFWALKDVSFSLQPGDRLALLGLNGAGKSTLVKAIAGIYRPTEGSIRTRGRIAPLIELGAGFEPQYNAIENIYLYGAILGYSRSFLDGKIDEILEFAELTKFKHTPIKNYSSGMRARLGFSVCTAIAPDILILDEVLSVGDAIFRKKSKKKILELMGKETTVLFVSHSLSDVKLICNKALILDGGRQVAFGGTEEVVAIYERMVGSD